MARVWQLLVRANGDTAEAQKELRALQKSVKNSGEKMAAAGRRLTYGLTIPIGLAAAGAVKLASDAGETASKLQVTFGKGTAQVTAQLDKFAAATGSSRYALREQAATIGALLKPMGMTDKAMQQMTVSTVQLAKDLSSFHNIAEDDALDKLRAGLTGESEPLKQLGILINENTVKEEAYARGIAKRGAELTEQQKVQARYSLILKQSADAQGDAERTSKSFANQAKALKNNVMDLGVAFGQIVLPAALKLVEKLRALTDWVAQLSPAQQRLVVALAAVAAAIGPVLWAVGSLTTAIVPLIGVIAGISLPVVAVVAALAALVAAFVYAYTHSEKFRDIVNDAVADMAEAVGDTLKDLRRTIQVWIDWGRAIWKRWGDDISRVVGTYLRNIYRLVSMNLANMKNAIQLVLAVLRGDWGAAWKALQSIVGRTLSTVRSVISSQLSMVLSVFSSIMGRLRDVAANSFVAIQSRARSALGAIPGIAARALSSLPGRMLSIGRAAAQSLVNGFKSIHIPTPHFNVSWSSVGKGPARVPVPNVSVKWYRRGGIVDGAQMIGVGEAGPEAIVPLGRGMQAQRDRARVMSQAGLGGVQITINGSELDAETIVRKVMFEMGRSSVRMGAAF